MTDPDRTTRMLDDAIARELGEHGTLLPPWRKYPGEHPFGIGWRMGAGEWYLMMYWRWSEGWDIDQWAEHLQRYAPVPAEWVDAVATALVPSEDADPEPVVKELADRGLVDLDAWRRHQQELAEEG